jgi:hypothetical protein
MRVALYARVSTHDQQTLPMQLDAMRGYVINHGWTSIMEIADIGSGASERPKRQRGIKGCTEPDSKRAIEGSRSPDWPLASVGEDRARWQSSLPSVIAVDGRDVFGVAGQGSGAMANNVPRVGVARTRTRDRGLKGRMEPDSKKRA